MTSLLYFSETPEGKAIDWWISSCQCVSFHLRFLCLICVTSSCLVFAQIVKTTAPPPPALPSAPPSLHPLLVSDVDLFSPPHWCLLLKSVCVSFDL